MDLNKILKAALIPAVAIAAVLLISAYLQILSLIPLIILYAGYAAVKKNNLDLSSIGVIGALLSIIPMIAFTILFVYLRPSIQPTLLPFALAIFLLAGMTMAVSGGALAKLTMRRGEIVKRDQTFLVLLILAFIVFILFILIILPLVTYTT
jgi:hypothetical protein